MQAPSGQFPAETLDVPSDPSQEIVVQSDQLVDLMVRMLTTKGMFANEARIGAARLIEADLRGIHSHGSRSIWRYLEAMDNGAIDPRAHVTTVRETAAIAVLDGGRGLGHVAATRAMELAIKKAQEVGTGTVAVCRGHHYGAASVYALMAVEAGLIGFSTTSTGGASVAAYGSRKPATANNAMAWGVPTRSGVPFVFDMACGVSSWGKVESLRMYGRTLPPHWSLNADGKPTEDPHAAKTLFPSAGARGYGLAFLASVLAGPLSGGKMPLHKTRNMTADHSEHFFYAIDPQQFVDPDGFYEEIDSSMAEIRALPAADGFDKVRLPGELEWERSQRWKRDGIPLHRDHVRKLEELAQGMKLAVPWTAK
jgi:ureidoglycolate dehydrogenase (NAD+)